MRARHLAILIVLGAIWGASFLFIRIAAPVLGAPALIDIRLFLAAGTLLLYALAIRRRLTFGHDLTSWLILGTINAAAPFTLIALAIIHLPASLAAILNSTTPLFTAVAAHFFLDEPFTAFKGLGLALGMVGVGALVGWSPIHLSPIVLLSVCFSLGGAGIYGLGGIYVKRRFDGTGTLELSIGQQAAGFAVLLPFMAVFPPLHVPNGAVLGALLALSLLSTAFAYLLYFYLMAEVGATSTLSVTFLVPIFGVLWSAIFLGERIGPGTIVGMLLILVSVTLVTGLLPWSRSGSGVEFEPMPPDGLTG